MRHILKSENLLQQALIKILSSNKLNKEKSSDFDLLPSLNVKKIECKPAAVLIPIIFDNSGPSVVFTKRAKKLKDHPGQISFPGGKEERSDFSEIETVIRECREEIYLKSVDINILGRLPPHETVTGYLISPFVASIRNYQKLKPQLSEVEEIFKVPLSFLLNKENMRVQNRKCNDHERRYYIIPYGPYYIWGATARIIKTFSELIEKYENA